MNRRSHLLPLAVFLTVSSLLAAGLVIILGNISFTDHSDYHAVFTNASGLKAGSPVRIAGVDVGKVDTVGIHDGTQAEVGFTVESSVRLGVRTTATVRYKNLIGDRYLELSGGSAASADTTPGGPVTVSEDDGAVLPVGATIPASRTTPALDLDTLLNGFKPLFEGLAPAQINKLSTALIAIFQGEGGTVDGLLGSLASVTSTLANRDQLIGQVIDNLGTTLKTVSDNRGDLDTLITQTQQLISGLSGDRNPITGALVKLNTLAGDTADLLTTVRPDLRTDVAQLGRLATTLDNGSDTLTKTLQALPGAYKTLARLGSYGNFFNFYLCSTNFLITLPNGQTVETKPNYVKAARCQAQP